MAIELGKTYYTNHILSTTFSVASLGPVYDGQKTYNGVWHLPSGRNETNYWMFESQLGEEVGQEAPKEEPKVKKPKATIRLLRK